MSGIPDNQSTYGSNESSPNLGLTRNPYVGLRPFGTEDAELFFGRADHIDALISKLKASRFVAVVGTSGSGKSSLVRAGLIPRLLGGRMLGKGANWQIAIFRPEDNPISSMASELWKVMTHSRASEYSSESLERFEREIRDSSFGLVDALRGFGLQPDCNLLLIVDQFEEVFRYGEVDRRVGLQLSLEPDQERLERWMHRDNQAEAFVKRLLMATRETSLSLYVLITMRSEFLGDCAIAEGLPEAVNSGLYLIPRLTRLQLTDSIKNPLAMTEPSGSISDPLVQQILNEISEDQDQLPVLQHALMRTWSAGNTIEASDFEAVGGIAHALSLHATSVLASLNDKKRIETAERIFRAITKPGPDGLGLRRPLRLSEICQITNRKHDEVVSIINVFRKKGNAFLMPPEESPLSANQPTQPLDPVIDIGHESLIRKWDKLRGWIDNESISGNAYDRLLKLISFTEGGKKVSLHEIELREYIRLKRTNHWNEYWAARYGGRYAEVIAFLTISRIAIRKAKIEEKKKTEQILSQKIRQKIVSRLRWGYILLTAATLSLIFFGLWFNSLKDRANILAAKSTMWAKQYGASSQEKSALLEVRSIRFMRTPLNSDLSVWEGFERLSRGILAERSHSPFSTNGIAQIAVSIDNQKSSYHILVLSDRATDGRHHVESLSLAKNSAGFDVLHPDAHINNDKSISEATALSSRGRYIARDCEIQDLKNRISFRINCSNPIRTIIEGSNTSRFATVESKDSDRPEAIQPATVRVWEPSPTGATRVAEFNEALVKRVLLSPDGNHIAMIIAGVEHAALGSKLGLGQHQRLEIADLQNGQLRLIKVDNEVSDFAPLAFSRDSKRLAVGGSRGEILLLTYFPDAQAPGHWFDASCIRDASKDTHSRSQTSYLPKHLGACLSGKGDSSHSVTLPRHDQQITALAFGNRSDLLASAGDDKVLRVIDLSTGMESGRPRTLWSDAFGQPVVQIAFSPNDTFLGAALNESTARIKYARTGIETSRVTHKARVISVAFSPDERFVFSTTAAGELLSFSADKNNIPQNAEIDLDCPRPNQASSSNDGKIIAVAGSEIDDQQSTFRPTVRIYQLRGSTGYQTIRSIFGEEQIYSPVGTYANCMTSVSGDGSVVAVYCGQEIRLVHTHDSFEEELTESILLHSGINSDCTPVTIAMSYNGSRLAIANRCGQLFIHSNESTPGAHRTVELKGTSTPLADNVHQVATALAFSGKSGVIAIGDASGLLSLVSLNESGEGKQNVFTQRLDGPIKMLQFSPDSEKYDSKLLAVGSGSTATVFDIDKKQVLAKVQQNSEVTVAAFSPNQEEVSLGTFDGTANVVDLIAPTCLKRLGECLQTLFSREDPRIVHETRFTIPAVPGWINPPNGVSQGPQFIYSLRFLTNTKLQIGASTPFLLERSDRINKIPSMALIDRDLTVGDDIHQTMICRSLREDTSVPVDQESFKIALDYQGVCSR